MSVELIVVFLAGEWVDYHRRPHWTAVAKRIPVLAIEPPADLLTSWRHPGRARANSEDRPGEGLRFFRPKSWVSWGAGNRVPTLGLVDRTRVKSQLKRKLESLKVETSECAFVVVDLFQSHLAGLFPEAVNLYEATDTFLLPSGYDDVAVDSAPVRKARATQGFVLSHSDLVVASSRTLFDELSRSHSNVHYLTNCVDYELFSKKPEVEPDDLKTIPHPRLGFAGIINDLLDYDLLAELTETHTEWQLVMIGPERVSNVTRNGAAFRRLKQSANVHFVGRRMYEQLPAFYHALDICLLPYRINRWMRYSSPNKLFQYLAAGKPVVSTAIPEVTQFSEVVFIGESNRGFLENVEQVLTSPKGIPITEGDELARENSTERRADRIVELIKAVKRERA